MDEKTPGQAEEIPEAFGRHVRSQFPADYVLPENEIAGRWKHMTSPRGRKFWFEFDAALAASDRIVRDVLESLCRRDGLSLEGTVTPGEPARNYELAERLGIGQVFGLQPEPVPASQVRRHEAQAAPELAAAMGVLRRVLEWFAEEPVVSSRRYASVTRAQVASAYLDGGLNVPEELRKFLGKRATP